MKMVEKIKKNYEENKKLYISVGVGVVAGVGFIAGARFHGRAVAKVLENKHMFALVNEAESMFEGLSIAEAKTLIKELNGEFLEALVISIKGEQFLIVRDALEV